MLESKPDSGMKPDYDVRPDLRTTVIPDAVAEKMDKPTRPTETVKPEIRAMPVKVDGTNRRSGNDGLEGHFVNVVDGKHKGRFGAFVQVLEHAKDGYPKEILVRTRDEFSELLSVAYEHVRPSASRGGR